MSNRTELSIYMDSINRNPILNREEERALAIEAINCNKARDRLVISNLKFVVQVANQFKAYTNLGKYSILDLIQEGNSGLMHAATKYDYTKGYRFITYAVWWIRAKIMSFIIKSHSVVKLGTTANERKLFFKMGQIRALLDINDSEERTNARSTLAKQLKTNVDLIKKMEERVFWHDTSIDKPTLHVEDSSSSSLKDFLIDETCTEEQVNAKDLILEARVEINKAMQGLTPREQEIIEKRYLGSHGQTLQAIASQYSLSRERIRQIEARAFDKMRLILDKNSTVREILTVPNTLKKEI